MSRKSDEKPSNSLQSPKKKEPTFTTKRRRSSTIKGTLSSFLGAGHTDTQATTTATKPTETKPTKPKTKPAKPKAGTSSDSRAPKTNKQRQNTSNSNGRRSPTTLNHKEILNDYLVSQGFLNAKQVSHKNNNNDHLQISMATSGDNVFLPTVSSTDDEYLARLNGFQDEEYEEDAEFMDILSQNNDPQPINNNINNNTNNPTDTTTTTNIHATTEDTIPVSTSAYEMDSSMVSYNVAIIPVSYTHLDVYKRQVI